MEKKSSSPIESNEKEFPLSDFRFSSNQSYFDSSLIIRIFIGLIFGACLFLFLHFRQVYIEVLELGTHAKKYVVSQMDFSFPDEEATIILKQQAAADIGEIYQIKEEEIDLKVKEFQTYITQDREGIRIWDKVSIESGFEKLTGVLGLFTEGLRAARFTDAKTLVKIEEIAIDEKIKFPTFYYPFIPSKRGGGMQLPTSFWKSFSTKVFQEEVPSAISQFVIDYFKTVYWVFVPDQSAIFSFQKEARAQIPRKMTQMRAGQRLIDQGEEVTPRHLAMIRAMKEEIEKRRNLLDSLTIAGSLLMTMLFLLVATVYVRSNHKGVFRSNQKLALLTTILILDLLVAKIVEVALLKNTISLIDLTRFPLFVPLASILLASLMSLKLAAFATVFLSIIFTMALAVESVPFLVINLFAGMVAILSTHSIKRRKEVFIICGKAWLATLLVILSFNLYENTALTVSLITDVTSSFIFMGLTAVLIVGLLPILETLFQIMTDITLMEFMDPTHELLRRLTIEAPGTYQHSLVVGNLSEAAANAIFANGLFCRVATLYHDVGKLINPQYFTENQMGGVDMHQLLTPKESADVIMAHVAEGVALARKVGLPEQFIDIIKEHHGTTLVYYFYHKELESKGGDKEQVPENEFRYRGPKPRTKESTIIMIADTLEAASRCLDVVTEENITALVESLVAQKAEDGQFDHSSLTFKELGMIKKTFIKGLVAAAHPRIKYPKHHPGEEG
ncbi:MAG: HDIG domain-containing protein [Chlamydiia bacterium]|nr:HDIG domain-containing protein [Chlamydiia bacterium]